MKAEMKKGKAVVGLGEVTGHRHRTLQECMFRENEQGLAQELIFLEPTELFHEDHDTHTLPKGEAEVIHQRELDIVGEVQKVMD